MKQQKKGTLKHRILMHKWLYIMLLPGVVYYIVFKYGPMFGLIAAFKDYSPYLGFWKSPWVGLKHFSRLFGSSSFIRMLSNTLILSLMNLAFYFPAPILIALLLNEVRVKWFKQAVQTIIYIPHFLSWVVIAGISYALLTTDGGVINNIITSLGFETVNFLGSAKWFRPMIVIQNIWKESGWGTIVFLAALAGVNVELYEAAELDGATRLQRIWHITLPSIRTTVVTMFILRLGDILETGFDQIYLMQNSTNRDVAQVIDTYVYEMGMQQGQLSFATAVGLFKSVVGLVLVLAADQISKKVGEEGIL